MTYLSVEHLSKSFGIKPLFQDLTFGISKGDKTALVAPNGTGKSTLLKVLAGKLPQDSGKVMLQKGISIGFLEQQPTLEDDMTIREYITQGHSQVAEIIREYEEAVERQAEDFTTENQQRFEKAMAAMDKYNAWNYEQRMQQILGKLNIHELDQDIASLSGGERKRVALAFVLIDNPDLLLLDEPTNHLDLDMIEWLEDYLGSQNITLLMITHDRYFLDRVCNHIMEIDAGKLYHHDGNYSYYLQKKAERKAIEQREVHKAEQHLKKEQEWMRRAPKARGTKSKSRIQSFYETKEIAEQQTDSPELRLSVNMKRMGNKILELKNVSKSFDDLVILDEFSHSFSAGERVGIIGKNGVGKSTFLNILTGEEQPDSGEIDKGSTISFGHYKQKGIQIDENLRVIEAVKEIAEFIELEDGKKISATQFLEHFMFTSNMQYTPIHKLSGGGRRRLGLMKTLIENPNFLILDEPTNDLDLMTLNRLEEFLSGFGGCLITVSHDRAFMDNLVDFYFVFEGDGDIREFNGTYEEYRRQKAMEDAEQNKTKANSNSNTKTDRKSSSSSSIKEHNGTEKQREGLSYRQQQEYKRLEKEVEELEERKAELEKILNDSSLDYEKLQKKSAEYEELQQTIDEKSTRWLELAEMAAM